MNNIFKKSLSIMVAILLLSTNGFGTVVASNRVVGEVGKKTYNILSLHLIPW